MLARRGKSVIALFLFGKKRSSRVLAAVSGGGGVSAREGSGSVVQV